MLEWLLLPRAALTLVARWSTLGRTGGESCPGEGHRGAGTAATGVSTTSARGRWRQVYLSVPYQLWGQEAGVQHGAVLPLRGPCAAQPLEERQAQVCVCQEAPSPAGRPAKQGRPFLQPVCQAHEVQTLVSQTYSSRPYCALS